MTGTVKTRTIAILTALPFLIGAAGPAVAGQSAPPGEISAVRLEPHEGKTQFLIGDPIRVDLVFTREASGYTVNTNPYTYLPIPDQARRPTGRGLEPIAHTCRRGADG